MNGDVRSLRHGLYCSYLAYHVVTLDIRHEKENYRLFRVSTELITATIMNSICCYASSIDTSSVDMAPIEVLQWRRHDKFGLVLGWFWFMLCTSTVKPVMDCQMSVINISPYSAEL